MQNRPQPAAAIYQPPHAILLLDSWKQQLLQYSPFQSNSPAQLPIDPAAPSPFRGIVFATKLANIVNSTLSKRQRKITPHVILTALEQWRNMHAAVHEGNMLGMTVVPFQEYPRVRENCTLEKVIVNDFHQRTSRKRRDQIIVLDDDDGDDDDSHPSSHPQEEEEIIDEGDGNLHVSPSDAEHIVELELSARARREAPPKMSRRRITTPVHHRSAIVSPVLAMQKGDRSRDKRNRSQAPSTSIRKRSPPPFAPPTPRRARELPPSRTGKRPLIPSSPSPRSTPLTPSTVLVPLTPSKANFARRMISTRDQQGDDSTDQTLHVPVRPALGSRGGRRNGNNGKAPVTRRKNVTPPRPSRKPSSLASLTPNAEHPRAKQAEVIDARMAKPNSTSPSLGEVILKSNELTEKQSAEASQGTSRRRHVTPVSSREMGAKVVRSLSGTITKSQSNRVKPLPKRPRTRMMRVLPASYQRNDDERSGPPSPVSLVSPHLGEPKPPQLPEKSEESSTRNSRAQAQRTAERTGEGRSSNHLCSTAVVVSSRTGDGDIGEDDDVIIVNTTEKEGPAPVSQGLKQKGKAKDIGESYSQPSKRDKGRTTKRPPPEDSSPVDKSAKRIRYGRTKASTHEEVETESLEFVEMVPSDEPERPQSRVRRNVPDHGTSRSRKKPRFNSQTQNSEPVLSPRPDAFANRPLHLRRTNMPRRFVSGLHPLSGCGPGSNKVSRSSRNRTVDKTPLTQDLCTTQSQPPEMRRPASHEDRARDERVAHSVEQLPAGDLGNTSLGQLKAFMASLGLTTAPPASESSFGEPRETRVRSKEGQAGGDIGHGPTDPSLERFGEDIVSINANALLDSRADDAPIRKRDLVDLLHSITLSFKGTVELSEQELVQKYRLLKQKTKFNDGAPQQGNCL